MKAKRSTERRTLDADVPNCLFSISSLKEKKEKQYFKEILRMFQNQR